MYAPASASGGSAAGGDTGQNARYAYLVGRLRNRQMTMEEATELFNLMQSMLQRSEAARAAMMRMPPTSPSAPTAQPPVPRLAAPSGSSDDFLLLGILAMGAGAGLLAAMTKRMQDVTTSAAPAPPSAPANSRTSTQKG